MSDYIENKLAVAREAQKYDGKMVEGTPDACPRAYAVAAHRAASSPFAVIAEMEALKAAREALYDVRTWPDGEIDTERVDAALALIDALGGDDE